MPRDSAASSWRPTPTTLAPLRLRLGNTACSTAGQAAQGDRRRQAMRLIGYARVSTVHQNLDRQLGALRAAKCKTVFQEKASGKDVKGRPELERAIDELGAGNVLVLAEWDRATRSMMDGIAIMQRVHA